MPASDPGVLILADDLSGAAEAAATLGTPVRILLTDWSGRPTSPESAKATPQDVALDLDCRYLTPVEAASRTRSALETLRTENQTTIIKVDSLLRGNVRAHLSAALESTNGPVIFAPALPQHNRTVIGGVPYIDGRRLADTRAWNIEDHSGPDSLNDLCPEAPTPLELDQLRTSSPHELAARFRSERLIVADAETMDDIGQVIALAASTGATVVGSAALARAIADGRALRRSAPLVEPPTALSAPVLFVLGTAADRIDGQLAHLQEHAQVGVLDIPATEVSAWNDNPDALHVTAAEIRNRLTRRQSRHPAHGHRRLGRSSPASRPSGRTRRTLAHRHRSCPPGRHGRRDGTSSARTASVSGKSSRCARSIPERRPLSGGGHLGEAR